MGPIFTYLCCQTHSFFTSYWGWHEMLQTLAQLLVFVLCFVKLLVVIKVIEVDFVCTSLKEETHEFR